MANKVTTISDIINRVASSCLTHRIPGGRDLDDGDYDGELEDYLEDNDRAGVKTRKGGAKGEDDDEEDEEEQDLRIWEEEEEEGRRRRRASSGGGDRGRETECFMHEVFDAVSAAKRAYVGLQAAHSPWDPDKIRVADAAVVAELRKLGRLRDRFRRGHALPSSAASAAAATTTTSPPLRDVVAPYEAAIEDLKRELKAKEAEMDNLKEKLRSATALGGSGRRGRAHSSKRVGCISVLAAGAPGGSATPEMFETHMEEVKTATKSFTGHLLSLMRSARWDISAAVRSIINGEGGALVSEGLDPHHAKYALESYVNRKIFQGFENETFYIEGSLGSLLRPAEFRRDCFAQFRDMKGMDPAELLGVLPTCQFGQFAAKKYAAIVHQRMEESLFGSTEQRRQVMAGAHPRTGFYGEFLRVAKAVWLLHLLAFALDPPPCHFEASKGAEFHPEYMESVTRFAGGGRVPAGTVVAFPVAPGFKLGDGSVIRARVYLLSGSRRL